MRRYEWLILIGFAATSCARSSEKETRTLTQRERDSIVSIQPLPGAGVVRRALKESDAAEKRAAKIDSLP